MSPKELCKNSVGSLTRWKQASFHSFPYTFITISCNSLKRSALHMFKTNSWKTNRERKIVNYQPWKICVCRAHAIPTYDTFSPCFLSFFLFALDFPITPSRPVFFFFLISMGPLEKNLDYKIWFVRASIWDILHYSETRLVLSVSFFLFIRLITLFK